MKFIKQMRIVPVDEGYYFLLNGLNSAVDTIDEQVYQTCKRWEGLAEIRPTEEEKPLYDYLCSRGYLCAEGEDTRQRRELMDALRSKIARMGKDLYLAFVLTYDCNFRCTYCYEKYLAHNGQEWLKRRFTPEKVKAYFACLDREGYTLRHCTLFGGEPLLPDNAETVTEILDQCTRRGIPVSIVTNGYYLDDHVDLLKKHTIKNIQVTLDGPQEIHDQRRFARKGLGTYERIITGITRAAQANLPISIRSNVYLDEEEYSEELREELERTGLLARENVRFDLSPIIKKPANFECLENVIAEFLKKANSLEEITPSMKQMLGKAHSIGAAFRGGSYKWEPLYTHCGGAIQNQLVDPNGFIYPCQIQVGDEKQAIGYFDGENITYNERYQLWASRNIEKLEKCRDCWAAFLCGGGCAYNALAENGDLMTSDCLGTEMMEKLFLPYLFRQCVKPTLKGGEKYV